MISFLQDFNARPLTLHPTQVAETQSRTVPTDEAGKVPTSAHLDDLCDVQHEEAIAAAGRELEAAQARYEASSCFGDAAARDTAKERFYALIRARSAAQTQRMEQAILSLAEKPAGF